MEERVNNEMKFYSLIKEYEDNSGIKFSHLIRKVDFSDKRLLIISDSIDNKTPIEVENAIRHVIKTAHNFGYNESSIRIAIMTNENFPHNHSQSENNREKQLTAVRDNKKKEKRCVPGVQKIILIISGKGGVGKSMLAVKLAFALAHYKGKKVSLLDADIHGPSIVRMSGVNDEPIMKNNIFIPPKVDGIKVMSMDMLVDHDKSLAWRGPMVTKMLYRLLCDTDWSFTKLLASCNSDYLIIDTPPGTGDIHLTLLESYKIDAAIAISTPQQVALDKLQKSIDLLNKMSLPLIGIVENMSYFENSTGERCHPFGNGSVRTYCAAKGVNFLGEVPISPQLSSSLDHGNVWKKDDALKVIWNMIADNVVRFCDGCLMIVA